MDDRPDNDRGDEAASVPAGPDEPVTHQLEGSIVIDLDKLSPPPDEETE